MKKFCLITTIICYLFAIAAVVCTILCSCIDQPTVGFYITMSLSFLAFCINGACFMIRYKEEKKKELYYKWLEGEVDD